MGSVGTESSKTAKHKTRSEYGADWKIATDMPGWEPGHRDITIKIRRRGNARGLKLQRGRLGFVATTGKPLSQMRITTGFRVSRLDGRNTAEVVKSNKELTELIESGGVKELTFAPPRMKTDYQPFGGLPFYRLFTDGGRRNPRSKKGEAGCGYVLVKGPFQHYKEGRITDRDGEIVARGHL